jgi:hypothetical protein
VLITALRDVGDHGDFSFSRLPNYPITKSHGSPRSSSPLPFRALPEHPRRQERNPENVCRVNAASGNSLENSFSVPSCPLWLKRVTFRIPALSRSDGAQRRFLIFPIAKLPNYQIPWLSAILFPSVIASAAGASATAREEPRGCLPRKCSVREFSRQAPLCSFVSFVVKVFDFPLALLRKHPNACNARLSF